MRKKLENIMDRFENSTIVQSVRKGMIMVIPVLTIGSISLILRSLPLPFWQDFITTFADGFLYTILSFIYNATFGMLSLFITYTISLAFSQFSHRHTEDQFSAPLTAVICFSILTGVLTEDFAISSFGVKGMFTAILSALVASWLYGLLRDRTRNLVHLYSDGADLDFRAAVHMILPAVCVALVFALVNYGISRLFGVAGFQELFLNSANALFSGVGRSFLSGGMFVLLSSLLWFFGIHGSDVLEGVCDHIFRPALEQNIASLAAGLAPTEIVSKTFIDVFVLMGGCGSALCLLFALLLFSRRRSSRHLAGLAGFPMLFNINELMIFGLPVILNPYMFIPFLLTPMVCYLISFATTALGWVPIITNSVEWTTPVLFSGYIATGSLAGSVLQLVCLVIGVLIYWPFIRLYDRERSAQDQREVVALTDRLKEAEETREQIRLTVLPGSMGMVAKTLAADLASAMRDHLYELYYQPQCDKTGKVVGQEALLRWKHPVYGMLYPPLVIRLADENNLLESLERGVLEQGVSEYSQVWGEDAEVVLSLNVSVSTMLSDNFVEYMLGLTKKYGVPPQALCLEVTEQMAMQFGDDTCRRLTDLRRLGFRLAIDDFATGFTSLQYLLRTQFDAVKLDGSLTRGLDENPRCREIIGSIAALARTLGLLVVAEYVETEEQRGVLEELGVTVYQGYLFGKAEPLARTAKKS